MTLTYQTITPFILALMLIFIFPLIMRRHGWTYGELISSLFTAFWKKDRNSILDREERRKNRKEAHLQNGNSSELMEMLSNLVTFTSRHRFGLVYPGTMQLGDELTTLLCLVVTRSEVIGINCYGFSGTISSGEGDDPWKQHINERDLEIPNPVVLNQQQYRMVRKKLDDAGLDGIPLRVVGVFTNRHTTLAVGEGFGVYTREDVLRMLRERAAGETVRIDPGKVAKEISALITKIKARKK